MSLVFCPDCSAATHIRKQSNAIQVSCRNCSRTGPWADELKIAIRMFEKEPFCAGLKTGDYRQYNFV